jgi:hypothetical protein
LNSKVEVFNVNHSCDAISDHKRSCKICASLKQVLCDSTVNKIRIYEQVKALGKFNFDLCKIPVNEKLDVDLMKRVLLGYFDMQVCDLVRFGFPIELELENNLLLFSKAVTFKNHSGANNFPEHMIKYLKKEASHGAIIGPFSSCPFEEGMVISPFNTVPKSNPNDMIKVFQEMEQGSMIMCLRIGILVDLVFPKIDDFVSLIKAKGQGCMMYKLDIRRAYRQISICPSAYNLVSFAWKNTSFSSFSILC